jgi:hypothetical protein
VSAPTATFSLAVLLSATSVFGALTVVGHAIGPDRSNGVANLALAAALFGLAAWEIRVIRSRRWVSTGPRRQTPRRLMYTVSAPVVGFTWGLDVGTAVTTYRATVGVWALVALCVSGRGSYLIGPVFAVAFLVPLVRSLWAGSRCFVGDPTRRLSLRSLDGRLGLLRSLGAFLVAGLAGVALSHGVVG